MLRCAPEDMKESANVPFFAATAHKLADDYGFTAPCWAFEQRCYLPGEKPYFGCGAKGNLRLLFMYKSPPEFKHRNLFVDENVLARVFGEGAPVETFISLGNLQVQTVSAEYLLAMKLMSARYGEKDSEDILFLMKKLGIETAEGAIEILLSFFPRTQILPKTQYIIEEMIERIQDIF